MIHTSLVLILIAVVTFSNHAAAREWKSVDESKARIVLDAPQFKGARATVEHRISNDNFNLQELRSWVADDGYLAVIFAQLTFLNSYIYRPHDYKSVLQEFGYFDNAPLIWGREDSTTNALGPVQYTTFSWPNLSCVGFSQIFGDPRYSDASNLALGAHDLVGLYCVSRAAPPLTDQEIDAVLRTISYRD